MDLELTCYVDTLVLNAFAWCIIVHDRHITRHTSTEQQNPPKYARVFMARSQWRICRTERLIMWRTVLKVPSRRLIPHSNLVTRPICQELICMSSQKLQQLIWARMGPGTPGLSWSLVWRGRGEGATHTHTHSYKSGAKQQSRLTGCLSPPLRGPCADITNGLSFSSP